ncbi:MAG: DUF3078 domain-containing protein, partial [Porphyromonadaceae bacterium]|nr:DUF3078 domain-containing protein [Porphyromonadaceae bacterium]
MKREIYILFCVLIMSLASYIHMNGQVVDIITLADTSVINSSYYVPIIDSDSVNDRIHSDSVHNALKKHKVADPIKEKLNYYLNGGWPNPSARTVATRLFTERLKLPLVVFPMDKKLEKPQLPTHLNFATNHSSEDFFHNQPIGLDQMEIQDRILNDMFKNNMWDFAYTKSYLDNYKYEIKQVEPEKVKLFSEEEYANTDKADNPLSNMEDAFNKRRYWSTVYESTLQFSQNYVSSNWYKGGSSNLNLFSRNYFTFEYNREKVKWFNELEYKLSVYNSQGDTVRKYRVADDLLRFHTNYGYKAYSNWYYSADAEVRTQLFNANKENSHDLQAALFSPITLDFGLG